MELIPARLTQYERDGFPAFPDLFTPAEEPNAVFRLGMHREAAAAGHGEATEAVGLVEIHDPPMDAVRVAGGSP
jgi:hypothetical protein